MALSKENTMAKNAHLVLDERATIEVRLRERASFTEIGRELGKDPSTISKDVGRILRTFKIKKNVEVTDNGKIII